MQSSDSGNFNLQSTGDEDSINFRPSPNFRHMKKYLKDKLGETSYSSQYDPSNRDKKNKNDNPGEINPPLPNQPPLPPPEPLLANFKKEVVNDDYIDTTALLLKIKTDPSEIEKLAAKPDEPDKPEETMCRNFVRNTCNRGAMCIYAHKIIISQLKGVYKFCIDFENNICKRPDCKYVHASLPEKEHFFRTGHIPPHALSHIKKVPIQPEPAKEPEAAPEQARYPTQQYPMSMNPIQNYTVPTNVNMMQNPYTGMISPTRQWQGMETHVDYFPEQPSEMSAQYTGTTYSHNTTPMYLNQQNMMQNPYATQWTGMEDPSTVDMSAHYPEAVPGYPHPMGGMSGMGNMGNVGSMGSVSGMGNVSGMGSVGGMSGVYGSAPPPPPPANVDMMHDVYAPAASPNKRQWTEMEEPVQEPAPAEEDVDYGDTTGPKKCRNCDVNELRLQHNKNKVKKMIEDTEDLDMRVGQITKKNSKLNEVLILLIDAVTEHCDSSLPDSKKSYGSSAAQVMRDVMAAERAESGRSPDDPYRLND